jgi:molybdenum cofactor synthesis domain-containing protein
MDKTELTIRPITLQGANLNDIAAAVADVLEIDRNHVYVTDVREDLVTLDVLRKYVDALNIVGKQERLLRKLAELPQVTVYENTSVSSSGMLGWIALDGDKMRQSLERSEAMVTEIRRRVSRRAIVFSTGFEVAGGNIEDTNTPMISETLQAEGYAVAKGPTLTDDELLIAANLRQAVEEYGYGLVITTGGVGAEDKDRTVEAVLALDPEAAAPYICKFEKGTGRHRKDGVRIAVAQVGEAYIVSLPGPNDEVKASLEVLVKGLKTQQDKNLLAESIARELRERLREKIHHWS